MDLFIIAIAALVTILVGWLVERLIAHDGYGHNQPPVSREQLSDWHQPGTAAPTR